MYYLSFFVYYIFSAIKLAATHGHQNTKQEPQIIIRFLGPELINSHSYNKRSLTSVILKASEASAFTLSPQEERFWI